MDLICSRQPLYFGIQPTRVVNYLKNNGEIIDENLLQYCAEYITEKYTNTKFRSIGTAAGWYGCDADSRIPTEYNTSEWKDPQGNCISYSYVQEP